MSWLRRFFRRAGADAELSEEIRFHLAQETQLRVERGESPAQASQAARRDFGNVTLVEETTRAMWGWTRAEEVGRDLRHSLRLLARSPVFAAAAILSLALGIGANAAIFQLLNAVRVRSLPVPNATELASIHMIGEEARAGRHTGRNREVSWPVWQQLATTQQAFSGLAAFGDTRFNLAPRGEMRYVDGLWVSGNFFSVLGVQPHLGRLFAPEDDRPGCGYRGAVISHAFWQREFHGTPEVIGKVLTIGSESVPVIGVTPAWFFGVEVGRRFDVALPLCSSGFDRRDHFWLAVIGRLKPGLSLGQANAHLKSLAPGILAETVPTAYRPDAAQKYMALQFEARSASSGVSPLRERYEDSLWILLAIAGMVLLIASANLANLMLARATARQTEFAIRLALGGSRWRLVRQLLSEGLVLAIIGAICGLLLASWAGDFLVAMISTPVDPIYLDLSLDWRILGFTCLVAGLTCVLFSLAPAFQAAKVAAIRPDKRGMTATRQRFTFRRALIVVQVAISFVLVFGALLFGRSFRNLTAMDAGFQQHGILIANVVFPEKELPPARRQSFYRDLNEKLVAIQEVEGVAVASPPPLSGMFWNDGIAVNGQVLGTSNFNQVSAGYFAVVGTPRLAGRDFGPQDTVSSPKVAIVNEAFAQRFLNTAEPMGRTFTLQAGSSQADTVYTIVGLVRNSKYASLREEFSPIAYLAESQDAAPDLTQRYVFRARGPLDSLLPAVRRVVAEASPGASMRFAVMETQIKESLLRERLIAALSSCFGLVAILLAVVGLYGVLSYIVSRRQNEIGIRMALGADRRRIVRMIFTDVAQLLAIGLAAGAGAAVLAARAASSLLYGLAWDDAATLALAGLVLVGSGLAAAFWPAVAASSVEPSTALRQP